MPQKLILPEGYKRGAILPYGIPLLERRHFMVLREYLAVNLNALEIEVPSSWGKGSILIDGDQRGRQIDDVVGEIERMCRNEDARGVEAFYDNDFGEEGIYTCQAFDKNGGLVLEYCMRRMLGTSYKSTGDIVELGVKFRARKHL